MYPTDDSERLSYEGDLGANVRRLWDGVNSVESLERKPVGQPGSVGCVEVLFVGSINVPEK